MAVYNDSEANLLRFAPFQSAVDSGFWFKLSDIKLDVLMLKDEALKIRGYYGYGNPLNVSGRLNVDYTAFDKNRCESPKNCCSAGTLYNMNTIERFRECDKKKLLDNELEQIWMSITSGEALIKPSVMNRFLLLTYVDLKKYHFYYWFAFPALCYPKDASLTQNPVKLEDSFSELQLNRFLDAFDAYVQTDNDKAYFFVHVVADDVVFHPLTTYDSLRSKPGKLYLGFCDPCTLESSPGWPLRNLLALAAYQWRGKLQSIDVICFREFHRDGVRRIGHSLLLSVCWNIPEDRSAPVGVGWELNEHHKKAPRKVNLSASMDPQKLAATSVDLNLKLMRWRLVPDLDLDVLRNARCLILGSGTLGCNVARCLMGWGIRNMTLVDNGRVSYSNPVRQSLFQFEDCSKGGNPKAAAAAAALKRIFPDMNAVGTELSIPMPGHFVSENAIEQTKSDIKKLESLIDEHDVVFLLTDTRESRWLPTVIAADKRKLVINAALGFDTFLVMRHGFSGPNDGSSSSTNEPDVSVSKNLWLPGSELGCYFCNDVVAPGDSTQNRTMDQQCTVTRPGLSMMASALAVELMVSVLQHPLGGVAPAFAGKQEELSEDTATCLGIVPHQIRGFLSRFYHIMPVCKRFDKCTACSRKVLDEYSTENTTFLLRVFNEPSFLEGLTGLTQLHADTQEAEVWELNDDESSIESS